MRVLLISTNRMRPSADAGWLPVEPLGAACVAAGLRRAGHETRLLDLCFVADGGEAVAGAVTGAIAEFGPAVIGLSFRNVETMAWFGNATFLEDLKSVADTCRQNADATIVLGGAGFSVLPAEILAFTGLELGVVGEGEWTFPVLLSRLETRTAVSDIPGVAWRNGGGIVVNPPAHGGDLACLPRPARDLIDHGRYIEAGGTVNVQTRRGCPFGCVYCTYPGIEGRRVRCRPPDAVAAELRRLHLDHGVRLVDMVDSQFNYPADHSMAICERLIEMRDEARVRWSCMLNPGGLSREFVLMLRAAGCTLVDLGIESGSDRVLSALGKRYTREDIRRAVSLLEEFRLSYRTWVLLGGPGEDAASIEETLDLLEELDVPGVLFSVGIRACPGTRLEALMREEGRLAPDADLLHPTFYLSMDPDDIADLVRPRCRGRAGWRIASLPHPDEV